MNHFSHSQSLCVTTKICHHLSLNVVFVNHNEFLECLVDSLYLNEHLLNHFDIVLTLCYVNKNVYTVVLISVVLIIIYYVDSFFYEYMECHTYVDTVLIYVDYTVFLNEDSEKLIYHLDLNSSLIYIFL